MGAEIRQQRADPQRLCGFSEQTRQPSAKLSEHVGDHAQRGADEDVAAHEGITSIYRVS
jgi:hypothetical protein